MMMIASVVVEADHQIEPAWKKGHVLVVEAVVFKIPVDKDCISLPLFREFPMYIEMSIYAEG